MAATISPLGGDYVRPGTRCASCLGNRLNLDQSLGAGCMDVGDVGGRIAKRERHDWHLFLERHLQEVLLPWDRPKEGQNESYTEGVGGSLSSCSNLIAQPVALIQPPLTVRATDHPEPASGRDRCGKFCARPAVAHRGIDDRVFDAKGVTEDGVQHESL